MFGDLKKFNRLIRILACVTVILGAQTINPLASFAESPSTGGSATLKRDNLMSLAFPGWRRDDNEEVSDNRLPQTEIVKLDVSGQAATEFFVEPLGVIRLDAHHAAMITSTIPIDPRSGELDYGCDGSNYCPYYIPIGAYIFTQKSRSWTLTSRADIVTTVFASGEEKFKVQDWPGHGLIVAFTTSYAYQGASVTGLALIALQPNRIIPLLNTSLSTTSDLILANGGRDLDCQDVLSPKYVQPDDLTVDSASCQNTAGHWHFEGNRVRLTFKWMTREDDGNGHLKPLKSWKTTAVLKWTGSDLKLVEGNLPEFGI